MDTQKVELEVGLKLVDKNSNRKCYLKKYESVFDPVTYGEVVIWSVEYSDTNFIAKHTEKAILLDYYFDIL